MRIGLVGFYGYNAYSDDLIALAIKEAFDERADVDWSIMPLGGGRYKDLDLVILGGGSLLGLQLPNLVRGLHETDVPFAIFGPGFRNNEVPHSLNYLWDRASLIGVRGEVSVDGLQSSGIDVRKTDFIGDPVFLLKNRGLSSDGYIRGVIRPHKYVDCGWMHQFLEWLSSERGLPMQLLGFSPSQGDWGGSIKFSDTYDGICRSSFWFGNRLHPFCVALINGIPAIAVEVEFEKVADVCSTIGYPHWVNSNEDLKEAYVRLMSDWEGTLEKVSVSIEAVRRRLVDAVDEAIDLC